jgi:hypothetical protein
MLPLQIPAPRTRRLETVTGDFKTKRLAALDW